MRRTAMFLSAAALLAVGCGDDDDKDTTSTSKAPPPDTAALTACLEKAKLQITPGTEPATNAKGETKPREGLELPDTTYLGYVQWPSKSLADVYVSSDAKAAEEAEKQLSEFTQTFGLDPAKYVRSEGTMSLLLDEPPPTKKELDALLGCAES